ncbi:MAG: 3',5'-cyclic-AMP phosphodiesterase [Gammaproteobacteria bacterium]|nr:3',5'-cyclic-AMP phosphodiesterase [Gammaproteobacteria bacterium]
MNSQAKSLRVLQITDSHLFAESGERLLGVDTQATLDAVLVDAHEQRGAPDVLLATGDLAQDGQPATYERLQRQLEAFGVPVVWLAGNHDDPAAMAAFGMEINRTCLDLERWRILMLDSTAPGEVGGRLGEGKRQRLAEACSGDQQHLLVCLHHHPVKLGSGWLDAIGLEDRDEFVSVLDLQPTLRAVLWGHIHQEYDQTRDGVRWLGSPSTCFQFRPGTAEFTLDDRAPGYRWLELQADGVVQTGVNRLDLQLETTAATRY